MTQSNVRETKDRILDATEQLVARQGIDATSLRQITSAAQVNLAAVNYHFQSKDELIFAVYRRRIRPTNEERLALLDELESTYHGRPIPLEAILHAFFEPVVNLAARMENSGIPLGSMLGRIYTEPSAKFSEDFLGEMRGIFERYAAAIHRSLPQLDEPTITWRLWFSVGIMAHTLGAAQKLNAMSRGLCRVTDQNEVLRQMVAYAKGGLEAPAQ